MKNTMQEIENKILTIPKGSIGILLMESYPTAVIEEIREHLKMFFEANHLHKNIMVMFLDNPQNVQYISLDKGCVNL